MAHDTNPSTGPRRSPLRGRRLALLTGAALAAIAAGAVGAALWAGDRGSNEARTSGTIAQPAVPGVRVAPESARVDLAVPSFTRPTAVDNPLFPVSRQRSVLLVGEVDGLPSRTEVTLLPATRILEWRGRPVETLVSQYVAFLGGRIHEVAYDHYAQDDTGAVWYFGEDVFNFADGAIADTSGSWLAGRDGPPAMIMPAHPRVGDVYRTENVPGLVFEEVTVKAVDRTLDGPLGRVPGGLLARELHADGESEQKLFAPGYGEFLTAEPGGDLEALALAVPTDAANGAVPPGLVSLGRAAGDAFDAAGTGDGRAVRAVARRVRLAWAATKQEGVPRRLGRELDRAVAHLTAAAHGRRAAARGAAIEVSRWALDLELRYRSVAAVDLDRLELWAAQLLVDAAAGDAAAANGDVFAMDYVRERVRNALGEAGRRRLDTSLEELPALIADGELEEAARTARQLRRALATMSVG